MRIDLNCPAETAGTELIRQGEDSWVRVILMNLTERRIGSCEATVRILDGDGTELGRTVHRARSLRGEPHSAFSMAVPMEIPEGAAGAEARLDKVWFEDNDVWRREKSRETEYEPNALPPGNELNALKYAAGEAAVGFPSQQEDLWVCVCGRPNGNRDQICARCRRQREMIFQQYNRNAVLRRVSQRERQLDLQTRGALEENNRLQRIREEEYDRARTRKAGRRRLWTALICAALAAALTAGIGEPALRLWSADAAMGADRLEDAKKILTGLGNFPGAAARLAETEIRIARRDGALAAEGGAFTTEEMENTAAFLREKGDGAADAALADRILMAAAGEKLRAGDTAGAESLLAGLPEETEGRAALIRDCAFARGEEAMAAKDYARAKEIFDGLGDMPGAADRAKAAVYEPSLTAMESGEYDRAIAGFTEIGDYLDSPDLIRQCQYLKGYTLEAAGEADAAREAYLAAGEYEDAAERAQALLWQKAEASLAAEDWETAAAIYREMDGYADAREKWIQCATELARAAYKQKEYVRAATLLEDLPEDTRDTRQIRTRGYYLGAKAAANRGELEEAITLMEKVADYSDAGRNIRNWRLELARQRTDAGDYAGARELLAPIAEYSGAQKLIREIEELEAAAQP